MKRAAQGKKAAAPAPAPAPPPAKKRDEEDEEDEEESGSPYDSGAEEEFDDDDDDEVDDDDDDEGDDDSGEDVEFSEEEIDREGSESGDDDSASDGEVDDTEGAGVIGAGAAQALGGSRRGRGGGGEAAHGEDEAGAAGASADPGSDSSEDEREDRNTIGNVPLEWYRDEPHIGYDRDGQKIVKKGGQGDALDQFLERADSSKAWRKIYDEYNDETYTLTREEVEMIRRIRGGQFPEVSVNPYEPYVDWATLDDVKGGLHPFSNAPEPKRRFLPSKWEAKKVVKLIRALRRGWLKPLGTKPKEEPTTYLLWDDGDASADPATQTGAGLSRIAAPKPKLPGHEESYNPPLEYLPTEEEKEAILKEEKYSGFKQFVPRAFDSLRAVPAYPRFVNERFERCLDLYLCPRAVKQRLNVDPKSLLPQLPKPRELQPFPTAELMAFTGHTNKVRSVAVDRLGQWLATGSDDCTVRVWEVHTGRCVKVVRLSGPVACVAWCPKPGTHVIGATCGNSALLLDVGAALRGDKGGAADDGDDAWPQPSDDAPAVWSRRSLGGEGPAAADAAVEVAMKHPPRVLTWHHQGDYFATVAPSALSSAVLVHQRSKRATQSLFKRNKGKISSVAFHPQRPLLFVATQRHVHVYNLVKQQLVKKLLAGVAAINSIAVHPKGDNLIVGSSDRKVCWFDMDLSTKPYKTFASHAGGVTGVAFHPTYPLFASGADDGTAHVFHGRVFDDLMQNPLLVPVKVLRGHREVEGFGVTGLCFHPAQPWLFTAGADNTARLFYNAV